MTKVWSQVILLLVLAASVGCERTSETSAASRASSADESTYSQIATSVPKSRMLFHAGVVGTLELQDDCLYLIPSGIGSKDKRLIPVFPVDQVAGSTPGTIVLHGKEYDPGDSISLTGGRVQYGLDGEMQVPDSCDKDTFMWMVSPH